MARVNMDGVRAKVQRIATNRGLGQFLASEASMGMDKYVPYRTGALSWSVSVEPFKVHYNAPYARYVFYGENLRFSTQQHPAARAHWDRGYAEAFGESLGNAGTEYIRTQM